MASLAKAETRLRIAIEPSDHGRRITADGAPFAEYRVDAGGKPVVWPLYGPGNVRMTRVWPLGERAPHESEDHPHQIGLWFGHGRVNGVDFWHRPGPGKPATGPGRVVHQRFRQPDPDAERGTIVTHNDWIAPGGVVVCRDRRTLAFGATRTRRWVDFAIELRPASGRLTFGDTKEGAFAIRVAAQLKTDARLGGQIVSRQGQSNADAWGARAAWVDYHGRVGDRACGVAIFSHPTNFRPRPRWHVRGYGLFAANPFGESEFPPLPDHRQGPLTLNPGEKLRLRYRLLMHLGDERQADLEALYQDYASAKGDRQPTRG